MKPGTLFWATTAATLLLCAGAFAALRPDGEGWGERVLLAQVAEKEWTRRVGIQELRTVTADSTEIPAGAHWVETIAVADGHTRVLDHYAPPDSTPVYRDEPSYRPRYRYRMRQWETVDSAVARTDGAAGPPAWPRPVLRPGQAAKDHSDLPTLRFTAGGETWYATVDPEEFAQWEVGQMVRLRIVSPYDNRVEIVGGVEAGEGGGQESSLR